MTTLHLAGLAHYSIGKTRRLVKGSSRLHYTSSQVFYCTIARLMIAWIVQRKITPQFKLDLQQNCKDEFYTMYIGWYRYCKKYRNCKSRVWPAGRQSKSEYFSFFPFLSPTLYCIEVQICNTN